MSAVRYGVPHWTDGPASGRLSPSRTSLRGEASCDVAIVGGGLVGCLTAFVFAQAGVQTMLLEAERLARQGTAGGPGVVDAGAGVRFAQLRERYGLRAARHMWESSRRSALELQALVRRLRLRCDLTRTDAIDVARSAEDAAALEREYRALAEAGIDATWLTGRRATAAAGLPVDAVLKRPDAATLDPFRLAVGLAHHAERRGAGVFERSAVRRITVGREHVELATLHGLVRAGSVVIATDRPAPGFQALHRHLRPVCATVAAVPALSAPLRRALGSDTGVVRDSATPPHAWRVNGQGTLVIWQTDLPPVPSRAKDAVTVQRTGQLMYEFSVLHPAISGLQPSHGWTSDGHRSHDGLVIAGPHRAFPRHLFAVGLAVDGLQGAMLAARLALRAHQGSPDKSDELFGFVR